MTTRTLLTVGWLGLTLSLAACADEQGDEPDPAAEADDADVVGDNAEQTAAPLTNAQWNWAEQVANENGCTAVARPKKRVEVQCPIATDKKVFNAYRAKLGKSHVGRTAKSKGYYILVW